MHFATTLLFKSQATASLMHCAGELNSFIVPHAASFKDVLVNREGDYSCPVQTLAIFALHIPYDSQEIRELIMNDAQLFKASAARMCHPK